MEQMSRQNPPRAHIYEDKWPQANSPALGADLRQMREFNRLLILNYVREHGPITRIMIAQHLELSRTTVTNIISMLLREGLVREGDLQGVTSKGGRPSILVHFNADASYILGIEVGRTYLTLLLTNLESKILAQESVTFDIEQEAEGCLSTLITEIQKFIACTATRWESVIGIGLSIPDVLNTDHYSYTSTSCFASWQYVKIQKALQNILQKPLYIENDANMGMLGEHRCGAGRNSTDMAYISVDLGIGGGLILGGHLYRGHSGSAGEIGHIIIDKKGPLCGCGKRGCLETLASTRAIIQDVRREYHLFIKKKHAQKITSDSKHILDINTSKLDINDVIFAAQNGDSASIAALEHAGIYLGQAIGMLVNLFNPALIVIGGSVIQAGDLLFNSLQRAAEASSYTKAWQDVRIVPGQLGTIASALGATIMVLDAAFKLPAISSAPSIYHEMPLYKDEVKYS